MTDGAVAPKVIAVVVTHRRAELLAESSFTSTCAVAPSTMPMPVVSVHSRKST